MFKFPFAFVSHTQHLAKPCIHNRGSRNLFSLPDISSFSPFSGSNGDSNNPQTYHERKILPYRRSQLYNIVTDVDSYPHFLPFCTNARILSKSATLAADAIKPAGIQMEAEMTVGFMAFKETYISNVYCIENESVEAVAASSTPLFKSLSTTWRLQPASNRSPHASSSRSPPLSTSPILDSDDGPTLVSLDLAFSFANPVHAAVSAAFFGQVSKMMVTAFEERCLELYGPRQL